MPIDFASVASKKMAEVEKPPLPPVGDYRWRIIKVPETTKSGDESWEFLRIVARAVEPLDNVDMSDYKGDPANITCTKQFMFNCNDEAEFEKTLYNVKQFLVRHVQCASEEDSVKEGLGNAMNGEFIGTLAWSQDKRDESGETFNAEIRRTAPVE